MKYSLQKVFTLLFTSIAISGCAIGPDYERPTMELPEKWRASTSDAGDLSTDWWKLYDDTVLNALVKEALEHNYDLAIAIANIEEASALLGIARSAQMPQLGINGGPSRATPSERGPQGVLGHRYYGNEYQANGTLSFEIDLWGKYRRSSESAKATLLGTEAAYETVRLSLIYQVVDGYFTMRANDQQLMISKDTLETRRKAEGLYHSRFLVGISGELEYRQAQVETTTAQAQVQNLEITLVQAENALSVLLGRSPRQIIEESIPRGGSVDSVKPPVTVPAGLPVDLISRRPDIITAEMGLASATANIGVAKAAFLPDISISGLFGFDSLRSNNVFTKPARAWSIGANLFQPIFQGGRILAEYNASNARERAAYASYFKAVQNAYREVQDALVANIKTRERLITIEKQVSILRITEKLALQRYDSGYASFLEVLDAQRLLFNSEIELASAQRAQLVAVSSLCKALGGGWKVPEETQPVASAESTTK